LEAQVSAQGLWSTLQTPSVNKSILLNRAQAITKARAPVEHMNCIGNLAGIGEDNQLDTQKLMLSHAPQNLVWNHTHLKHVFTWLGASSLAVYETMIAIETRLQTLNDVERLAANTETNCFDFPLGA